ncbi:hypothetical protein [Streptomyces erythrochromogenes]|uniref:hypothetical protein n=1 Tax=Streptomyces erythrochromogenes TaxID=285574 RepID=UPI0033CC300F
MPPNPLCVPSMERPDGEIGESGDTEARRQAEDAVVPGTARSGADGPPTAGRKDQSREAKAKDPKTSTS